jgi:hypothetical protein
VIRPRTTMVMRKVKRYSVVLLQDRMVDPSADVLTSDEMHSPSGRRCAEYRTCRRRRGWS